MARGRSINWTPEMDALLGTAFDHELAERFNVSPIAVGRHRRELGISARRHADWSPEMELLIGTMPDSQLGEQLGVSADAVRYHKYKLGVPSWQPQSPDTAWTPEMDNLLGTASDEKISIQLGITRMVITRRRLELGLPSWLGQQIPTTRKQRELELLDTLTLEQWLFACRWFNNCCAYCGQETFLTKDHLVPVKKGGPRTVFNILPTCWPCNNSKRAQRAHLWIYQHFGMVEGQCIVNRIVRYLMEVSSQWS